jgi:type III secretory pathway component EscV
MFSSFKQQGQQWQQVFARGRSGGPLQRVLAWLLLGLMLFIGLALLVFMLLLSWILIPILLFRHRAKVKAWQQRQQAAQGQHTPADSSRQTIEGEVLQRRED